MKRRMDKAWPRLEDTRLLGKRVSRIDGPDKVTGRAKYTYDVNRDNLLYMKFALCPFGHARIKGIDLAPARAMPGVVSALALAGEGSEIVYAGVEVAAVAAETEEQARAAARAIRIEYEVLEHNVEDKSLEVPESFRGKPRERKTGDVDKAFDEADVRISGTYGAPIITHCCLEAHGSVFEPLGDDKARVHASTQSVSGLAEQIASVAGTPMPGIEVECQHLGGGFGSKFQYDSWDAAAASVAEETGRPVKVMLERDHELMVAGSRPSATAEIEVAAAKDGTITGWRSVSYGSSGPQSRSSLNLPYVFRGVPNTKTTHVEISTNSGPARAWRAPGHPQACLLTMAALEDTAAALGMDPIELLKRNLSYTDRADVYAEELDIAARLIGWKSKWKPRDQRKGTVRRGLGVSLHTWGGGGHGSRCETKIGNDGSVEVNIGTQDLGVGTRTVLAVVTAETLGLPVEAIRVNIGNNRLPPSGPSGGSTTVGGISSSSRTAAVAAANQLFEKVAAELGADPSGLEARDGRIQVIGASSRALSWKDACSRIGPLPIVGNGETDRELMSQGVGGVQIAEVEVDLETGVVAAKEFVAVQDCGTIIDLKTAESQVYGAVIMGITSALYEERVMDPVTGGVLNPDMEFYRLAGIEDVGQIQVHMMQTPEHHGRGVVGLGEPPVISPMAAVSNAVANAAGVRVPRCPLTPQAVLAALGGRGV